MKKIIAVLAVILLAVGSAQAVTVLMDENFDSADDHVDLDTLPGWVNNNGTGVFPIFTTYRDIEPVDVGRGIYKYGGEYGRSSYDYTFSNVTLGAGEYYRYESYWHVTDGPVNQSAHMTTRLQHSDNRIIQFFFEAGAVSWQEGIIQMSIWTDRWDLGGEEIMAIDMPLISNPMTDVRFRFDIGPDGVTGWYNPGEAPGSGWILFGEALASDDSRLGFTGGLDEVEVELFSYTNLDWPQADSLRLTVEGSVAIPEPATICLLALAGTVLLARRRR